MSDALSWIILIGLFAVLAGVFSLSRRLEKNLHETINIMMHCNDQIVGHLRRLPAQTSEPIDDPIVGLILERRHNRRRDPRTHSSVQDNSSGRNSTGRRTEDPTPVHETINTTFRRFH